MKKTLLSLALLGTLAFGAGCVSRTLVGFSDHGSKPLTTMSVSTHYNFVLAQKFEAVTYSCLEEGDSLQCKRVCGGSNDLVCPEFLPGMNGTATNTR